MRRGPWDIPYGLPEFARVWAEYLPLPCIPHNPPLPQEAPQCSCPSDFLALRILPSVLQGVG